MVKLLWNHEAYSFYIQYMYVAFSSDALHKSCHQAPGVKTGHTLRINSSHRLFIDALWSPAGRADLLALVCDV